MLISTEKKPNNFNSNKIPKEKSDNKSCKMDYSPCFSDRQRIKKEEKSKENYEQISNAINSLTYFEREFHLNDFFAIQKTLKIENFVAGFCLQKEITNSNSCLLKENLLLENFCDSIINKELKEILNKIIVEYKSLIKVTDNLINGIQNISEQEKKANSEKCAVKQIQEERVKFLFSQIANILNNFEFRRDNNLERNLNDAYITLEILMYIFCNYFIYFREVYDFDFNDSKKVCLNDGGHKYKNSFTENTNDKNIFDKNNNSNKLSHKYDKNSYSDRHSLVTNSCLTKENPNFNRYEIFDGFNNNENPERKNNDNQNQKNKLYDKILNKDDIETDISTKLSIEEEEFQAKISFISLMFNLFEEENFLNLFNCLLFTLDKIKNKTFHNYYSAINAKYLSTLFTTGKKSIKHFDNLIAFTVYSKQILKEQKFSFNSYLLKITESQINRFQIQSEFLDRLMFEYYLLNYKEESEIFFDKFSNLNRRLDSQLLFISSFFNFWNKEKFYNVHHNIDFNTVFHNSNEALNQMINFLKPKLIALLDNNINYLSDPQKLIFNQNSVIENYLENVSLENLTIFVDFLKQFICNHIYAAYTNDNNFELINRTIWIKPIIEIFSLSNFLLKLMQINYIVKTEIKDISNKNNTKINYIDNCFELNYNTNKININEELVYKFMSHIFNEIFDKIFTIIPIRMLYLREIYMLNILYFFLNFLEKNSSYLEYFKANPQNQIIFALEKVAKFQNKFFFLISNYILKLIFPERKHKLRIYSFQNFPLDYFEIEESESLKSKVSEIIFGRADTNQLLINDRWKFSNNKSKKANKDDDYTNPNNALISDKNIIQNYKINEKITHDNNPCKQSSFPNTRNEGLSANLVYDSTNYNYVSNSDCFIISNKPHQKKSLVEEYIEQDIQLSESEEKPKNQAISYHKQKQKTFDQTVDISNVRLNSDAILIDSIVNDTKNSLSNNGKSDPNDLIQESKNSKVKKKDSKPKSLSKAQIKKRLSFQSEIFFDFTSLFPNFQFDHLKLLEKINSKKLKFSYLSSSNKITNLNARNSQSFENSFISGEKLFLKIINTNASLVLMQKEDEILFFDDSNFSDIKNFFSLDMVNKADLEYFLLIGENNLKDNNLMLNNYLNNFENCDLKNVLNFENIIENMYLFLD